MYRQSPSRNQRSKGVKVKYAFQICLLLAVCFWLIHQVKHSHDKKKEFEENEAKALSHLQNIHGNNLNLGRKGIYDRTSQNGDEIHEPIEEEETIEEENKPEEDENKLEEDENKLEEDDNKLEEEEQEEKNVDHEQENPHVDENEAREVDFGDGRIEGEQSLLDESEHNGDDSNNNNKSKHESREENYKADDASSAVTHEAQTGAVENSNEKPANKMLEEDNKEVRKDFELEGGEIAGFDQKSNLTISEMKVDVLDDFNNGSPPNDTLIIEISSRDLTSNDSAEVKNENRDLSETKPELDHDPQASELVSNSTDSTATKDADLQHYGDISNSSNNNTDSLSLSGNKTESSSELDEIKMEKTDVNDGTYETSESTATENPEEEIQQDNSIDKSDAPDSQEEKHVLTDLNALPEKIHTEGTNNEDDVAAE